jgi:transcriptional regulator with XRE-family HTH domain
MQRAGVNASQLARLSGLHRATISEWLNRGAGAITIQSVYLVADALGEDRADALRAAGNLPIERDVEVDLILASDRSDARKAAMIERLMLRREEERQRRLDDIRFALDANGDSEQRTAS